MDLDFEPFMAIASMLYGTSFVAERYSGIRQFLESPSAPTGAAVASGTPACEAQALVVTDARLLPVTRHIISGAGGCWSEVSALPYCYIGILTYWYICIIVCR